ALEFCARHLGAELGLVGCRARQLQAERFVGHIPDQTAAVEARGRFPTVLVAGAEEVERLVCQRGFRGNDAMSVSDAVIAWRTCATLIDALQQGTDLVGIAVR